MSFGIFFVVVVVVEGKGKIWLYKKKQNENNIRGIKL